MAIAVAIDRTPHNRMSSSTAVPSMRLAKRVCRMPRSEKIRVITGIDVTATAEAKTNESAPLLSALPSRDPVGMTREIPSAIANGRAVPRLSSQAVSFRFSRPRTFRTCAPETNIRNSSPSW